MADSTKERKKDIKEVGLGELVSRIIDLNIITHDNGGIIK